MPKAKPKGGAATPRQFRFTDEEIAEIDEVARTLAEPGIPVSRIAVLRMAFREFKARRMKAKAVK
jgi:hypothetical protein